MLLGNYSVEQQGEKIWFVTLEKKEGIDYV
jgi:hypothetical protein